MKIKLESLKELKKIIFQFINEKRIYCISTAIIVCIIFAISSIFIVKHKDKENLSGNLFNNGLVASLGKWTYYIKEDGIYQANSNGEKINKILECKASYLNVEKKKLYFVEYNENDKIYNLVNVNKKGENKQIIIKNIDNKIVTVANGWIYYLQDDIFYKIRTNGKDKIKLLDKEIATYQIKGDKIYYTYKDNISYVLAKMNTNGTNIIELESDCNSNFYVKSNNIYYIKEKYNTEKYQYEYTLCKMKTNGKEKKEVIKLPDTIKQINMNEDGIYYLTTEDFIIYKLLKMDYRGETTTEITNTNLNTKINVIGNKVFYTDVLSNEEQNILYKINIKGENKQIL